MMMIRTTVAILLAAACSLAAHADPIVVQIDPASGGCHTLILDEPTFSATYEQCEVVVYAFNGSSFDAIPTSLWCNAQSCLPADDDDCLAVAPLANPPYLGVDPSACAAAIADGANHYYEVELIAQEGYVMLGSLSAYGTISQPIVDDGR